MIMMSWLKKGIAVLIPAMILLCLLPGPVEQALQSVSWEMGHERADITLHYLR